jgi:hypothetical protein
MHNGKFRPGHYTVSCLVLAVFSFIALLPSMGLAQQYTGKLRAKKADISSQLVVGSGATISTVTGAGFFGDGSGLYNLNPGNISAGSLPGDVIASSIAAASVTNGSIVSMDASKLTGTVPSSTLDDSSVTLQGNTFNGPNQLVQLNGSGALPAIDGSNLTGVTSVAQYKSVGGYNGTLGIGTTFFSLVPTDAVTISKIVVTITEAGEAGSTGTTWKCGSTNANSLSVTSTAGAAAGTVFSASGTKSVGAGVQFGGWMNSTDEDITPSANVICEYK